MNNDELLLIHFPRFNKFNYMATCECRAIPKGTLYIMWLLNLVYKRRHFKLNLLLNFSSC